MKKSLCFLFFQLSLWLSANGQNNYEATLKDIEAYSAYMTAQPINGNEDYTNQLTVGSVVYYQTNEGRWGKLRVQEYGYNLVIEWTTYNNDGTAYTYGSALTIRGTWQCDLDLGKESSNSIDFWWNQQTNVVRSLTPKSGARFYKVNYAKKANAKAKKEVVVNNPPVYQPAPDVPVAQTEPQKTKKQPARKNFRPRSNVASSETYYALEYKAIMASENKMQKDINLGGLKGTPVELKPGSILLYKTTKDNFGKLQILSFGQLDTISELYIRWATFDEKGKLVTTTELGENVTSNAASRFEDLDGSAFAGYDFYWEIKNDLLFIKARKDAKFYLLKNNESITVPEVHTPSVPQQNSTAATISWQHPLSNNSTTSDATVELKACVETSETVREYILIQNGQKLSIARGLIPRKANDCLNAFSQTVTLKNGENKFQLMIQTAKGDLKSAIFTTYFNPNTSNTAQTAPPQYSGTKTRRLALVIGNADYVDNNGLKNPVNDATDVAAALREIGFEVMTATNTNLRKMTETMDAFGSKLKNYDVGLFYYAGHGLQVRGENYLVPIDAKPQTEGEVAYDCFPVGKLLAKMEDASNRANIIVLDACRDNPLKRSWSRSTGGGGGLANMTAPSGTFIGFATAPGSTAADGTGRNGVFTSALLEHIRKANLSVDQLFNAVNGSVKKLTNNQQIPWKTSSFSEDLYLTR